MTDSSPHSNSTNSNVKRENSAYIVKAKVKSKTGYIGYSPHRVKTRFHISKQAKLLSKQSQLWIDNSTLKSPPSTAGRPEFFNTWTHTSYGIGAADQNSRKRKGYVPLIILYGPFQCGRPKIQENTPLPPPPPHVTRINRPNPSCYNEHQTSGNHQPFTKYNGHQGPSEVGSH